MEDFERPSPEPLLERDASPSVLGRETSGDALDPSHALLYRAWGIPAVLSRGTLSSLSCLVCLCRG